MRPSADAEEDERLFAGCRFPIRPDLALETPTEDPLLGDRVFRQRAAA
jgi:hypothetical protein